MRESRRFTMHLAAQNTCATSGFVLGMTRRLVELEARSAAAMWRRMDKGSFWRHTICPPQGKGPVALEYSYPRYG